MSISSTSRKFAVIHSFKRLSLCNHPPSTSTFPTTLRGQITAIFEIFVFDCHSFALPRRIYDFGRKAQNFLNFRQIVKIFAGRRGNGVSDWWFYSRNVARRISSFTVIFISATIPTIVVGCKISRRWKETTSFQPIHEKQRNGKTELRNFERTKLQGCM